MSMTHELLPTTWSSTSLSNIALINPGLDKSQYPDELEVTFIPMPAVEAGTGVMDTTQIRPFGLVKKGYTPFQKGDVLFAKITPCMENGKMAVVPALTNNLGFGSTEFHVVRAHTGINARYLYYYLSSEPFRREAERNMTGAVGQRRVPAAFLENHHIPVAPLAEQHRVVEKIEELFSELDKGVENLKAAREQLKFYRQSLLRQAFEGKLTSDWRKRNSGKLETAEKLLGRVEAARTGKHKTLSAPSILHSSELPHLPMGWAWFKYRDICKLVRNGISRKPEGEAGAKILRISAVRPMRLDTEDSRFISAHGDEFSEYYLQSGDLLFTRYNGSRAYVGVCAEYKSDGSHLYPDKLIRTQLILDVAFPGYIEKAVSCGPSRAFIESKIRTTAGQSGISGADIASIPVPLCGLDEQREISRILDEVFSGLDRYEQIIEAELLRSDGLRQSILQRAFSGQLVPQDPNDEPAPVLLERIRAEKADAAIPRKTRKPRKLKDAA